MTCNRTDVGQAIRNPSERYLCLASGATGELRVRSALKEQRHLKLGARLQRERAERLLAAALTPPVAQPDASGKHGNEGDSVEQARESGEAVAGIGGSRDV